MAESTRIKQNVFVFLFFHYYKKITSHKLGFTEEDITDGFWDLQDNTGENISASFNKETNKWEYFIGGTYFSPDDFLNYIENGWENFPIWYHYNYFGGKLEKLYNTFLNIKEFDNVQIEFIDEILSVFEFNLPDNLKKNLEEISNGKIKPKKAEPIIKELIEKWESFM